MAHSITDEVYQREHEHLGSSELAVLAALAWHAHKDTRQCFPGNALLQSETSLGKTAVSGAVTTLASLDYIGFLRRDTSGRKIVVNPPEQWKGAHLRETYGSPAEPSSSLSEPSSSPGGIGSSPREPSSSPGGREQVREPGREQVSEPGRELPAPSGAAGDTFLVRTPKQPVTDYQGLLDYFLVGMRAIIRDHGLPIPGAPPKKAAVFAGFKRVRLGSDPDHPLTYPQMVELVDLYMANPIAWNKQTHPLMDFVSGATQARLRNRQAAIGVASTKTPSGPLVNEKAMARLRKAAGQTVEGSDSAP